LRAAGGGRRSERNSPLLPWAARGPQHKSQLFGRARPKRYGLPLSTLAAGCKSPLRAAVRLEHLVWVFGKETGKGGFASDRAAEGAWLYA